jgi:hypothetical protein
LRVDAAAVTADTKLEGKYLLRTCDPQLSDIALGYKQLLEVERGWRDMKQVLDLRPDYRLSLARGPHPRSRPALLARAAARPIVETQASPGPGHDLAAARAELQRLHVGTFTGPAGLFRQTTPPSAETRWLHTALDLPLPPRILDLGPEQSARR